ncbi:MAG: hypothetical protein PVF66_09115 [Candidatus Aminicenantes bacterium]|jgi:hypothetical protein
MKKSSQDSPLEAIDLIQRLCQNTHSKMKNHGAICVWIARREKELQPLSGNE